MQEARRRRPMLCEMEVIWRGIAADYRGPRKDLTGVKINATEITENYAAVYGEQKWFGNLFALMPTEARKPRHRYCCSPRTRCKGEKLYDVYRIFSYRYVKLWVPNVSTLSY